MRKPMKMASSSDDLPPPQELASDSSDVGNLLRHLRALRDSSPANFDSLATMLVMSFQMHLGKLGFGAGPFTGIVDPPTRSAIRRFEVARHLTPTGNPFNKITLGVLANEMNQVQKYERAPGPRLPIFGASTWETGYVLVEGQWVMSPAESASDEAVRIECTRETASCEILYARRWLADNALRADKETYRIASWDDAEIVSRPLDYPCARYLLRINRVQESATLVRSTLSTRGTCTHMTPTDITMRIATWDESFAGHRELQRAVLDRLYLFEGPARQLMVRDSS